MNNKFAWEEGDFVVLEKKRKKISKESSILSQAKQLVLYELDVAEKTILDRWRNHVGTTKLKQLPIDEQSKQNLLNIRLRMFYDESDALTQRMYTGDVTLGDFQEQFKSLIREFHTSSAAIGKGGWDQMNAQAWGRLGTPLREQYKWLQGFVDHIDANRDTVTLKYLENRARLYGHGALQSAILSETPLYIADLLPTLPKAGDTSCLNRCHCRWELDVVKRDKTWQVVEATWKLGVAEHCDDCKDLAKKYAPLVIRVPVDVEVPSVIGGY